MANGAMPLMMACPGKALTVVDVYGGRGIQRRLADMGLTPGVQVKVVNGQFAGPVLIDLRGTRLGLGRGVAQKIMVKEN